MTYAFSSKNRSGKNTQKVVGVAYFWLVLQGGLRTEPVAAALFDLNDKTDRSDILQSLQ
jgi:hypothetical protein